MSDALSYFVKRHLSRPPPEHMGYCGETLSKEVIYHSFQGGPWSVKFFFVLVSISCPVAGITGMVLQEGNSQPISQAPPPPFPRATQK